MEGGNKSTLAKTLGISRGSLYYTSSKDEEDWLLKVKIEEVLREHNSYGSRRIAHALKLNRKRIQRIMRKFGLKVRRRRKAKKYGKSKVKVT